ncbi:Sporulation kinase E [Rubripirellula amarantea]|uniref:histidine kinase n=2 Tax=Rubripirellula amarantea TaxID=2527999 RepID=A0A5C5WG52_9BACT|nr:Sporulation kinase E [Rubripirellula amarantea]
MVVTALLAAVAVAIASYWLGDRWAQGDLKQRFDAIERSLAESTFPLNPMVLDSLADLTQTELVGLDLQGNVTHSTIDLDAASRQRFSIYRFATSNPSSRQDRVSEVEVLFDKQQIAASRQRAAILPLVTGLSTILALSSVALLLSSRLVSRFGKLQRRVELVAGGDFESTVSDDVEDELGRLGGAVDSMAAQLSELWKRINRQQSEKLLHQIAGGMAHQLRNSLTGARMAVELHASQCRSDDEGIEVAIEQIEVSEDYVRRLLLVASGRQDEDRPADIRQCFLDIQNSLSPIAKHLRVNIDWNCDDAITGLFVQDGPTWIAAASNLVHNAMQAGDDVKVALQKVADDRVRLVVSDNGSGIADSVADELFEPFVTSKPEGMGLGLSVVRRAAERLEGDVRWRREDDRTIFELDARILSQSTKAQGERTS